MKKLKIEMNEWNDIEEILKEYWEKIQHMHLRSMPSCEYMKKPYVENNLFQYVAWNSTITIEDISYEDIFLYIKNNYRCTPEDKSNIQKYVYVHSHTSDEHTLFSHVVRFMIEYIRFYMTMVDFIYLKEPKNKELSTFIYLVWNQHQKGIDEYSKHNMHFVIFSHLLDKTYQSYKQMVQTLHQKKLIQENHTDDVLRPLFYQHIFAPWMRIKNPEYDMSIDSTSIFPSLSHFICMCHN